MIAPLASPAGVQTPGGLRTSTACMPETEWYEMLSESGELHENFPPGGITCEWTAKWSKTTCCGWSVRLVHTTGSDGVA